MVIELMSRQYLAAYSFPVDTVDASLPPPMLEELDQLAREKAGETLYPRHLLQAHEPVVSCVTGNVTFLRLPDESDVEFENRVSEWKATGSGPLCRR